MLSALLFAACLAPAATDWVEISQQHYRKPARPHAAPHPDDDLLRPTLYPNEETWLPHVFHTQHDPVRFTPNYHEDETSRYENIPKDRRIYLNHSLSEHTWNQYKYPPSTNVKRVDTLKVRPNITPEFSLEIYEQVAEKPVLVTRNKPSDQEKVPGTIERVPSKGSVKRVELSNTPVKSPTVTNAVSPIGRNYIKQYGSTEEYGGAIDPSDILNNEESTSLNDEKHVFSSKKASIRNIDKITTSTLGLSANEPSMPSRKYIPTKHTPKSDTEDENNNNGNYGTKTKNIAAYEENDASDTTTKLIPLGTKVSENIDSGEYLPDTATNKIEKTEIEKENFECTENCSTKHNSNWNTSGHSSDENSAKNEKSNEDIKVNTMENVMKFIKVIADTIAKNTKRGVNGKVKYLNELKESLLCSIQERIEATWPDDSTAPARRRSRSAIARGHVEFPSSESSLMTISFLTFAVFLIKLVLQVIQTYKNKTMMVAPLVVATAGRAVGKLRDLP